jgi:hypothetical protein
MRASTFLVTSLLCGCAAQSPPESQSPPLSGAEPTAPVAAGAASEPSASSASPLTDQKPVAFRADFANLDLDQRWNLFGGQNGNREVKGDASGLLVRINDAERPWDAVGVRTAKVAVDGDFDLRARFREFSAAGNGSAKLIVVDAASPRGEAAYVERIQIDGKNLFKFGGEIEGNLENWGYVPTEALEGDLRLVREGQLLHAYARPNERAAWSEFAKAQPVPPTMPAVVKVGVKLSAETHRSASVRFVDFSVDGKLLRK